jgi:hypothetical protein
MARLGAAAPAGTEGASQSMIPKSGFRFPACAKPSNHPFIRLDASAGEGRSEKIMLQR